MQKKSKNNVKLHGRWILPSVAIDNYRTNIVKLYSKYTILTLAIIVFMLSLQAIGGLTHISESPLSAQSANSSPVVSCPTSNTNQSAQRVLKTDISEWKCDEDILPSLKGNTIYKVVINPNPTIKDSYLYDYSCIIYDQKYPSSLCVYNEVTKSESGCSNPCGEGWSKIFRPSRNEIRQKLKIVDKCEKAQTPIVYRNAQSIYWPGSRILLGGQKEILDREVACKSYATYSDVYTLLNMSRGDIYPPVPEGTTAFVKFYETAVCPMSGMLYSGAGYSHPNWGYSPGIESRYGWLLIPDKEYSSLYISGKPIGCTFIPAYIDDSKKEKFDWEKFGQETVISFEVGVAFGLASGGGIGAVAGGISSGVASAINFLIQYNNRDTIENIISTNMYDLQTICRSLEHCYNLVIAGFSYPIGKEECDKTFDQLMKHYCENSDLGSNGDDCDTIRDTVYKALSSDSDYNPWNKIVKHRPGYFSLSVKLEDGRRIEHCLYFNIPVVNIIQKEDDKKYNTTLAVNENKFFLANKDEFGEKSPLELGSCYNDPQSFFSFLPANLKLDSSNKYEDHSNQGYFQIVSKVVASEYIYPKDLVEYLENPQSPPPLPLERAQFMCLEPMDNHDGSKVKLLGLKPCILSFDRIRQIGYEGYNKYLNQTFRIRYIDGLGEFYKIEHMDSGLCIDIEDYLLNSEAILKECND